MRSDANGEFSIDMITPGQDQIEISHANYTSHVQNDIHVNDGTPYQLGRITLRAGATISGTVYDEAGQPLRGAQVQVNSVDNPGRTRSVRTNSSGRFTVKNVAEGNYKVSAMRAQPTGGDANPFFGIIDMKNSEVQLTLVEGGEYAQDLHLGES